MTDTKEVNIGEKETQGYRASKPGNSLCEVTDMGGSRAVLEILRTEVQVESLEQVLWGPPPEGGAAWGETAHVGSTAA